MVDLRVRFSSSVCSLSCMCSPCALFGLPPWSPAPRAHCSSRWPLEPSWARPPQASACSTISSLLELERKPLLQTLASPYFEFDPNHPLKPSLCLEQLPPLEPLPRGSIEAGGLLSPCSSYWLLEPLGCGLLELQPCLCMPDLGLSGCSTFLELVKVPLLLW